MSLQDITITGSIKSIATQSYGQRTYISSTDEQSFPIETITGSQAGTFPNFVPGTNYTVDLIVNVTQSWSENIITPLGIVNTTHNTMEEFIDGEFSGSNYVVTNGSLNDAQCEQFLTVNTTPTNYSIFPYSIYYLNDAIQSNSGSLNTFLNINTSPNPGQIFMLYTDKVYDDVPPSVKYTTINFLKISRYDQEGNDNTLSLQELTTIRWVDSEPTVGEINLNVLNITEYPDYYLYAVESKTWVNIPYFADDNVLNYSLSASFTGPSASAGLYYLDQWNVINSSGGTFNTYYYTFDVTPNCPLKYTASVTAYNGNASPVTFDFSFVENTYVGSTTYFNTIAQTQSVIIPSLQSRTFTLKGISNGQFIGNPSVQYHLETKNLTAPISLSNTFWIVTHSIFPQSFTSSVVIEPYLLSNFANSDCDVLMNNYSENDYSKFYREVLYDNGGTVPSNLQQIINGTAQFAEVNDYLYAASANILPRYNGVRTTSADFNLPSQNGLTNEELSNIPESNNLTINIGTPNVENTTTYFGYFTSLKSNNPILKGTTSPVLKYLIREDGEVSNPAADEATYYNIVDSFPRGTKAYTNLLYNTTTIFNSTQSVLLSGESYKPVLYTISASIGENAYFDNPVQIDFNNLQGTNTSGTPTNYDARIDAAWGQLTPGTTSNIWINPATGNPAYNVQYDTASGFDPNRGTPGNLNEASFEFFGTPLSLVDIELTARLYTNNFQSGSQYKMEVFLERLPGPTTTSLGSKSGYVSLLQQNTDQSFKINNFFPLPNDIIYATISNLGTSHTIFFQYVPRIIITTKGLNIPVVAGPGLWTTGSSYGTVLTSSAALGAVLVGNYRQTDIPSSGFDPIELPCQPKVGDEIRFEYDESLSYRIIDVLPSSSGTNPITYLYLDRTIPPGGFNLDHFTIRRKVKDYITGITLDSNLISQIDEGFLMPEYPSADLKKNLPKIINDLSQKNVI